MRPYPAKEESAAGAIDMGILDTISEGLRKGEYLPIGGAKSWAAADDRKFSGRTVGMSAVTFYPKAQAGAECKVFQAVFEFAWVKGRKPEATLADEVFLAAVSVDGAVAWRHGMESKEAAELHGALWSVSGSWHASAVAAAADIALASGFGEPA